MSLLLDALKKAAEDKKRLKTEETTTEADAINPGIEENKHLEKTSAYQVNVEESALQLSKSDQSELKLIDMKYDTDVEKVTAGELDNKESVMPVAEELTLDNRSSYNRSSYNSENTNDSVSSEAIRLLVDKTNRDFNRKKLILVSLVTILSITILITGGLYYLQLMQRQAGVLAQRHNNATRMIREKTSEQQLPEKNIIIEKLAGAGEGQKKSAITREILAKQQVKVKRYNSKTVDTKHVRRFRSAQKTNKKIDIQKHQHIDPVGTILDNAWQSYEKGNFDKAKTLYKKVLSKEKNNRDALLGLGAIALQNKAVNKAQQYYSQLLKLNPDDPEAIAVLTSMLSPEQSINSEQQLKNRLQRTPASAPLNFSLGNIYAAQKRWKAAQSAYFSAWVNDKTNPVYTFNLAVSLDQLGKIGEAKTFYQKSLNLSGNSTPSFSRLSVLDRLKQIKTTEMQQK